ncbi:MAG: XRE family transcriptional regulator [Eggerthellaceae bacterium]|jgi:hypothetical protein
MTDSNNSTQGKTQRGNDEPLTEQALEKILTSPSIDAAAQVEEPVHRDLPGYLQNLMAEKGIDQPTLIRNSGLNYNHAYDVINGRNAKGVSRNKALGLCFGARCTPREAQRLLWHAQCSRLYARNRRDAIILFCLEHHQTLAAADEALYRFGEETIDDAR